MTQPNEIESIVPCSGRYSLKADLRLSRWLLVAVIVYLIGVYLTQSHPDWPPFVRGLVKLAPLVPGMLYVRSWFRLIRSLDELQRRLQLEVFLTAALGTVLFGVVIDTLRAAGFSVGLFRDGLSLGVAFVAMLILWTIGTVDRIRRYR